MRMRLKNGKAAKSPHGGPDLNTAIACVDRYEIDYRGQFLHFTLEVYASQAAYDAGYPSLHSVSMTVHGGDFALFFGHSKKDTISEQIRDYLAEIVSRGVTADIDFGRGMNIADWVLPAKEEAKP